jgi:hypothetical protein
MEVLMLRIAEIAETVGHPTVVGRVNPAFLDVRNELADTLRVLVVMGPLGTSRDGGMVRTKYLPLRVGIVQHRIMPMVDGDNRMVELGGRGRQGGEVGAV